MVRNADQPGMIGAVGVVLGEAGLSISSMAVGPSEADTTAMMVLSTDGPAPDEALERLRGTEGIIELHRIRL